MQAPQDTWECPVLKTTLQALNVTSKDPIPHWTVWDKCIWEDTAERPSEVPKRPRFQIFKWKHSAFHFSGSWGGGTYTRWVCSLEELLWAMTLSCKASGNVLTIPRLYVGGCIPLSVRDGYMEMTNYSALQSDSELGFGSEEESVTYCRFIPSRWESSTRGTMTLSERIKDSPQHSWEEIAERNKPSLFRWGVLK